MITADQKFKEREEKEFKAMRKRQDDLTEHKYSDSVFCCTNVITFLVLALLIVASVLTVASWFIPDWFLVTFDAQEIQPITSLNRTRSVIMSYKTFSLVFECEDSDCETLDPELNRTTTFAGCVRTPEEASSRITALRALLGFHGLIHAGTTILAVFVTCRSTRVNLLGVVGGFSLLSVIFGTTTVLWFASTFLEGWLWCDVGYCEAMQPSFTSTCSSEVATGYYAMLSAVLLTALACAISFFGAMWFLSVKRNDLYKAQMLEFDLEEQQQERRRKWEKDRRDKEERDRKANATLGAQDRDVEMGAAAEGSSWGGFLPVFGFEEDDEGYFDSEGRYYFNDPEKYKAKNVKSLVAEKERRRSTVHPSVLAGGDGANDGANDESSGGLGGGIAGGGSGGGGGGQNGSHHTKPKRSVVELGPIADMEGHAGVRDWTWSEGFYFSSKLNASFDPTTHKYFDHTTETWKKTMWYHDARRKSKAATQEDDHDDYDDD